MASSTQSVSSLHQEKRFKRKHTSTSNTSPDDDGGSDSNIRSTDTDDDDDRFLESIKRELLTSRKQKKKKPVLPPGFLQPLFRPSAAVDQVVATLRTRGSPEVVDDITDKDKEKPVLRLPPGFLQPLSRPSAVHQDQPVATPRKRSLPEVVDDITDKDNDANSSSSSSCRVIEDPNKDRSTSLQPNIAETNGHTIQKGGHCGDLVNMGRKEWTAEVDDDDSVEGRAKKLQSSLPPQLPSFVKAMMPSHVGGYFRLSLPTRFSKHHLPDADTTLTLEDEMGDHYEIKYLSRKVELGSGWSKFATAHNLVKGDYLVFQLANPTNFKVYIVRSNGSDQVDGDLNKSASADDVVGEESIELSTCAVDFKNVRSLEDFVIIIDGLVLTDREIPKNLKVKYYELCRSQGQYLHQHLVKGLNRKLGAGIITQTVNIADKVKANYSEITSETFREWVKVLSSFKGMGMEVDFLLDRVQKLREVELKSEMLKDARMERDRVKQEKMELEAKLKVSSEALKRHSGEVKKLEKMRESMLHEIGNAPW